MDNTPRQIVDTEKQLVGKIRFEKAELNDIYARYNIGNATALQLIAKIASHEKAKEQFETFRKLLRKCAETGQEATSPGAASNSAAYDAHLKLMDYCKSLNYE